MSGFRNEFMAAQYTGRVNLSRQFKAKSAPGTPQQRSRAEGLANAAVAADELNGLDLRSEPRVEVELTKGRILDTNRLCGRTASGIEFLVRLAGIEPTTLGFGGQYSIH